MPDLAAWLAHDAPGDGAIAQRLERSSRRLVDDWWHAGDLDTAFELATARLGLLAIEPPSRAAFADRHRLVEAEVADEEQQRRHQLGFVAVHANQHASDGRRFYCLGSSLAWETGEPPWALLADDEHRLLLARSGPPGALEAPYSGAVVLPAQVRAVIDLDLMPAFEARQRAADAFAEGRYADVLAYTPKAIKDGDHGLLAQLLHVEALARLGRLDDARRQWAVVADEWMWSGRQVWDTQWRRLAELHAVVGLSPADPLLAQVRARC